MKINVFYNQYLKVVRDAQLKQIVVTHLLILGLQANGVGEDDGRLLTRYTDHRVHRNLQLETEQAITYIRIFFN